jgi:two-component system, sensor histidine kinase
VGSNADRRILVVDDYEHESQALSFLFSFVGYEVRVANSGRAALSLIDAFEPHVVTLDIDLGDMTGFEVARAIRSRSNRSKTYIVAVTGRSQDECRPLLTESGFDAFMQKPLDFDQLHTICRERLERAGG